MDERYIQFNLDEDNDLLDVISMNIPEDLRQRIIDAVKVLFPSF